MTFRTLRLFIIALAAVLTPSLATAQGAIVAQSDLDTPPRLASQEMTARILARSYPPALKRQGITGNVELEFVVDESGRVEGPSVKVVESTNPELADAAKSVIEEIRFRPAQAGGKAVRTVVTLPITYK
ncbi:MAG: energy transducer TonB [Gemmatimonadaceae bacterium]|nr:energy transducer TonB [Gemmatimonadaceae bacterium]